MLSAIKSRLEILGKPRVYAPLLVIAVIGAAYLSYAYFLHISWDWAGAALKQFGHWIVHTAIGGDWPQVQAPGWGILLTVFILFTGFLFTVLLLPKNTEKTNRLLLTLILSPLLGFAAVGLMTEILALAGRLDRTVLLTWSLVLLAVQIYVVWKTRKETLLGILRRRSRPGIPGANAIFPAIGGALKKWQTWACGLVGVIILLAFFHALFYPVTEWDAVVYHAAVPRLWYMYRPDPPLFWGPSVGIEMSGNYPSIYPGMGAYYYVILNVFDDFYVRLLSPVFFIAVLLAVYFAGRQIKSKNTGLIGACLAAATPVVFIYAVWPTFYMLFALTILAALIMLGLWAGTKRREYLLLAGIMLGVALNTTYLAFYVIGCVALILIVWLFQKKITIKEILLPALAAIVTGCPPYLHNLIVLNDPIYPLGNSVFPSLGITTPAEKLVYEASEAEITNNAIGYWKSAGTRLNLLWQEARSLVFDKNLLPAGSVFSLSALAIIPSIKSKMAKLMAAWPVLLAATQLIIGWFWIRTILLVVPEMAVLAALCLKQVYEKVNDRVWRSVFKYSLLPLLAGILLVPGVLLAWSGPNQATWTTNLDRNSDFTWAWRHIGQTSERIANVYNGDAAAWDWLNEHLRGNEKVATLDNRNYYLRNPLSLFYLDGSAGVPLLDMDDTRQIADYLRQNDVKYIYVPSWVTQGPEKHPLYDKLPLDRLLGAAELPLCAVFATPATDRYTRIYQAGPADIPPFCLISGGKQSSSGTVIPDDDTSPRLFLSTPQPGFYRLTLDYHDDEGEVDINLLDGQNWISPYLDFTRSGSGKDVTHNFVFYSGRPENIMGIYVRGQPLALTGCAITYLGPELVYPARDDEVYLSDNITLKMQITGQTTPPIAGTVLRFPSTLAGYRLTVTALSPANTNLSIELWEGAVTEATDWWTQQESVSRAPALPVYGTDNPQMAWTVTPGTYTLMAVLWDAYTAPMDTELLINLKK